MLVGRLYKAALYMEKDWSRGDSYCLRNMFVLPFAGGIALVLLWIWCQRNVLCPKSGAMLQTHGVPNMFASNGTMKAVRDDSHPKKVL